MSIAKVNSTAAAAATTSSLATSIGWTPVAGNVLVLYLGGNAATTRSVAASAGFTRMWELWFANSSLGGYCGMFVKISAGNENTSPPTLTVTGGTMTMDYIVEEWPGVTGGAVDKINTSSLPAATGTPNGYNTGGTAASMAGPTLTMLTADCLMLTAYGGRGSGTQPAPTWGGGAIASTSGATGQAGFIFSAAQEVLSSGSNVTHTATGNDSIGGPVQVVGSVLFNVGLSGGGGGSSTTRKVNVSGVATTASTRTVNVNGTPTTATRKVNVNGVAT